MLIKDIIFKIGAVILAGIGIYFAGSNSGRKNEQNKQLKDEHNEMLEDIKINKDAANMSFNDKSDFLLSKQRNKDNW